MTKTPLNPGPADLAAVGRSAGVAAGDFVFATATALDPATGRRVSEAVTIADETRICLRAVEEILAEARCTLGDLAKATCYLSDNAYRAEFWAAYGEVMGTHGATRLTLAAGLEGDARVVLDIVAALPRP